MCVKREGRVMLFSCLCVSEREEKVRGNEGEACKSGASSASARLKFKKHRSCFLADKSN